MKKWNLCTGRGISETRSASKLHLMICEIEGFPIGDITNKKFYIKVQIKWKAKKSYFYGGARDKSNTTRQCVESDGCVRWNEGFEHNCNFRVKDHSSSDWKIELKIQGQDAESISKPSLLAKVSIDTAEFAGLTNNTEKKLELPFACFISESTVGARLIVKLRCPEAKPQQINGSVHPVSPTQKLVSSPSFFSFEDQSTNRKCSLSSDSEDDEQSYKRIIETNLQNTGLADDRVIYNKDESWEENHPSGYQEMSKPSLLRLMSWNGKSHGSKVPDHPRDTPLLNKAYSEDGGDDIDHARRCLSLSLELKDRKAKNEFQSSEFMGSDRFEVGKWEKRKFKSRDGKLELVTEMFLASIDQRSDKASGEGACSVLAAVIADWLHQNPKFLPLKCQFDKLIKEGSLEWRKLCKEESHKRKFTDQHFDLDTVLQAQVRPLMVVPEKSYIGFFELENMPNQLDFLQGAMSFDSIWQELQQSEPALEDQIYVVSWNDHFFVLKIEKDAIYTIDTLGERLSEGCRNAYILKFNKDSKVYRVQPKSGNLKKGSNSSNLKKESEDNQQTELSNSEKSNKRERHELIGEGKLCCKEFIKGFLAAVPLEELQGNIQKGLGNKDPLHRLLQIEFQYMTPYPLSTQ
ncbi:hypothetical protein DCAR_0207300 [Daucus carota subsp. sativus]|uniref:Uncharacterized protein n=1 Tax=Daucus carota subsp. sativus TaxID=79200 RepID=A0A161Y806_DAUCS|nr:PREDICTED: uncharacterized protein LOC108206914 isoform X1 [Daucus carota subsp. sativus]WOG88067.1 hypothetical protein DCAR_0207300 [Daucus carota subsp. sativus]